MTTWNEIEGTFTRLRDFVIEDGRRMAEQRTGGNFALVALVMTACDAFGRLVYGRDRGDQILARCLPDHWKAAAPTVYDALRHGLLHAYEAQSVVVDGERYAFCIAWGGDRHLAFAEEDERLIIVVARRLFDDLERVIRELEVELRGDQSARSGFQERDRKGRELHVRGDQVAAWKTAVVNTPVMSAGAVEFGWHGFAESEFEDGRESRPGPR